MNQALFKYYRELQKGITKVPKSRSLINNYNALRRNMVKIVPKVLKSLKEELNEDRYSDVHHDENKTIIRCK